MVVRSDGTTVHRVRARTGPGWYVKAAPERGDDWRFTPAREADRLRWLTGQGLPAAGVVEVGTDGRTGWLVTTALPGRPAAGPWSPEERARVVDAVADVLAALHALPAASCPFDRGLAVSVPRARAAVRDGLVDLDDLEDEHRGWSGERLLAELEGIPAPAEDDVVVCHGDPCLDNMLVGDGGRAVTGLLDVGRLGRADRWLDLAVLLRNLAEDCAGWGFGPVDADRFRARYGGLRVDPERTAYYRLLDEFV